MGSKSKSKSKGVFYALNRRRNSKKMVEEVLQKPWHDIRGVDLSLLYENKWTTADICKRFNTTSLSILHRIRYH